MKLEVVVLGVSDVDRAKAFYKSLGWRLDGDFVVGDGFRAVQMTPHNSEASIIFGKGVTSVQPGSAHSLVLAVDDVEAARADLVARGVAVSEVFHYAGAAFNNTGESPRVGGATRKPYLLHVRLIRGPGRERLAAPGDPDAASGREWKSTRARATDVATWQNSSTRRKGTTDTSRRPTASTMVGLVRALPERASEGISPEEAAAAADRQWRSPFTCLPMTP